MGFVNYGWTEKTTLAGRNGRWMRQEYRGGPIKEIVAGDHAYLNPYAVKSYVELPRKQERGSKWRKVQLWFSDVKPTTLCVVEPGGRTQEFPPPGPCDQDRMNDITFEVDGPQFYLATKDTFVPALGGITDRAIYGYFVLEGNERLGASAATKKDLSCLGIYLDSKVQFFLGGRVSALMSAFYQRNFEL